MKRDLTPLWAIVLWPLYMLACVVAFLVAGMIWRLLFGGLLWILFR